MPGHTEADSPITRAAGKKANRKHGVQPLSTPGGGRPIPAAFSFLESRSPSTPQVAIIRLVEPHETQAIVEG